MKPPAIARSRWTRLWTRDIPYACPRCGQTDTLHLHEFLHGENSTWPCPHCQATLTLLETRKGLIFLSLLPLPIAMALGHGEARWLRYSALLLALALSLWLRSRMSRMEVALMPEPKDWA